MINRRNFLQFGAALTATAALPAGAQPNIPLYVAESGTYYSTSKSATWPARFAAYRALGATGLRIDIGWRGFEPQPDVWRAYPYQQFFEAAVTAGFRFKTSLGAYSGTPGWFFTQNPDNNLTDTLGTEANIMSPWCPQTLPTIQAKVLQVWASVDAMGLFPYIDDVVVDLGLACEAIYPPPGFVGQTKIGPWWCDQYAQAAMPQTGTADVLTWYRDTKRQITMSQLSLFNELRQQYAPNARLVVLIPGTHYTQTEWNNAVMTGQPDFNLQLMTDSSFLLDQCGIWGATPQIDSVPQTAEKQYLLGYAPNLWFSAENAGGNAALSPQAIMTDIRSWAISLDYVNAGVLFNQDGVTTTTTYASLKAALQS